MLRGKAHLLWVLPPVYTELHADDPGPAVGEQTRRDRRRQTHHPAVWLVFFARRDSCALSRLDLKLQNSGHNKGGLQQTTVELCSLCLSLISPRSIKWVGSGAQAAQRKSNPLYRILLLINCLRRSVKCFRPWPSTPQFNISEMRQSEVKTTSTVTLTSVLRAGSPVE